MQFRAEQAGLSPEEREELRKQVEEQKCKDQAAREHERKKSEEGAEGEPKGP
jgi:hypothetical protein